MSYINRMSHVDEAGFFHIDMRGVLDVHLKYGPWESRLPVFRWENDTWQPEPHDPGIPLLHLTDIAKPDLPINQFAAAIPLNIRKKLSRFDYLQTTLLQLMARYEDRAVQLLNRCPLLLWMLAHYPVVHSAHPQTLSGPAWNKIYHLSGCARRKPAFGAVS